MVLSSRVDSCTAIYVTVANIFQLCHSPYARCFTYITNFNISLQKITQIVEYAKHCLQEGYSSTDDIDIGEKHYFLITLYRICDSLRCLSALCNPKPFTVSSINTNSRRVRIFSWG